MRALIRRAGEFDQRTLTRFGNHDCRDPNGWLEPRQMKKGGSYRFCCTSRGWVGAAPAARLRGFR